VTDGDDAGEVTQAWLGRNHVSQDREQDRSGRIGSSVRAFETDRQQSGDHVRRDPELVEGTQQQPSSTRSRGRSRVDEKYGVRSVRESILCSQHPFRRVARTRKFV
jgi:hypothetical protein